MTQFFHLFNLDSPIAVANSVSGGFSEFFFSSGRCDAALLEALWNPGEGKKAVKVLPAANVKGMSLPIPAEANIFEGFLGRFSTEVITMILGEFQDIAGLFAFMATCQRLWDIGCPILAELVHKAFTTLWAGDRLVVFGDYSDLEDFPPEILDESELKFIEDRNDGSHWNVIEDLQERNQHRNFDALQSNRFPPRFRDQMLFGSGVFASSWVRKLRGQEWYLLEVLANLVSFEVKDVPKNFFGGRAVLRNLKTKEYICWTTVMNTQRQRSMLRLNGLSFEHVLYRRTVWSSDPRTFQNAVYRGIWAGHPFDVSHIESVQDENGSPIDGWKDVSAEVVEEVAAIWEQ